MDGERALAPRWRPRAPLPADVALWLAELRCGGGDGDSAPWTRATRPASAPVHVPALSGGGGATFVSVLSPVEVRPAPASPREFAPTRTSTPNARRPATEEVDSPVSDGATAAVAAAALAARERRHRRCDATAGFAAPSAARKPEEASACREDLSLVGTTTPPSLATLAAAVAEARRDWRKNDWCAGGKVVERAEALAQLERQVAAAHGSDTPPPPADECQLHAACGEFLALCADAAALAEAAIADCPPPRPIPDPTPTPAGAVDSPLSPLSDDVFASEGDVCVAAVNRSSIFDDGVSVPVPPPRLNKMRRNKLSSNSSANSTSDCADSLDNGGLQCDISTTVRRPQILRSLTRERKVKSVCNDFKLFSENGTFSCSLQNLTSPPTKGFCESVNVSNPSTQDFAEKDFLVNDGSDVSLPEVNIPLAKPVSSFVFPASTDLLKPPSPSGTVRSIPSSENLSSLCDSVLLGRPRKGSGSSDIAAWKRDLTRSVFFSQDDECMQADEWFSSTDGKGRVYYFEENSSVSSWALPNIVVASEEGCEKEAATESDQPPEVKSIALRPQEGEKRSRVLKTRSMFNDQRHKETSNKASSIPRNWLKQCGLDEDVLKHGNMNRTKITENGKKLSKKWAAVYVILTEHALCFYKDQKSSHNSVGLQPELSMQLSGARVESGEKHSSRKHVFLVTSGNLQLLCECESAEMALQWRQAISNAIAKLSLPALTQPAKMPPDKPKMVSVGRSKSLHVKNREVGSIDDAASNEEQQMKIRDRLKKFFNRRPTREILASKGIYKDEPVFDSHLEKVCPAHPPFIPDFVNRCIKVIESKEENMKTDGLYRASGNLSHVQKIRLQVDQNNLSVLEAEEDVHVLTGALKLFFRELKEPLIPYDLFNKAIDAGGMTGSRKKEKLKLFREIVKQLPRPNHDTLQFLLKHLRNVTAYQEFNRMQIPNLAIVFGPTLMWREKEFNHNIAIEYMQQNQVIEFFLQQYDQIFS